MFPTRMRANAVLSSVFVLGLCRVSAAQEPSAALREVIQGFVTHGVATGDLNGDHIPDVAVLLARADLDLKADDKPLTLRVYIADKSGKLTLKTEAPKVACLDCGGIKGGPEPYDLTIAKGVLSVSYNGGSRETMSLTTKWRIQKGDFELIGVTESQMDTVAGRKGMILIIERDVNVSTLQMEENVERIAAVKNDRISKTRFEKHKCAVPSSLQGSKLSEHVSDDFKTPKCTNAELE